MARGAAVDQCWGGGGGGREQQQGVKCDRFILGLEPCPDWNWLWVKCRTHTHTHTVYYVNGIMGRTLC